MHQRIHRLRHAASSGSSLVITRLFLLSVFKFLWCKLFFSLTDKNHVGFWVISSWEYTIQYSTMETRQSDSQRQHKYIEKEIESSRPSGFIKAARSLFLHEVGLPSLPFFQHMIKLMFQSRNWCVSGNLFLLFFSFFAYSM